MIQPLIYVEHAATSRLNELGLTEASIHEAVGEVYYGHLVYVTPNEPPISFGMTLYLKLTGTLRDVLLPLGWKRDNSSNHAKTISPDGKVSIVVAGGTESTGDQDVICPSTKSPKGKISKQIIDVNQLALDLKDERRFLSSKTPNLWFLLVYIDKNTDEIRIELSRPQNINKVGNITAWAERIIINPFSLNPESAQQPSDRPEISEEIDINIRRLVGDSNVN